MRALLSLAKKLRGLAGESDAPSDRSLFLEAAAALEARAHWMAQARPGDRDNREMQAAAHRPVDMVV